MAVVPISVRHLLSSPFSATSISRKGIENVAIWQDFGQFLTIFSLHVHIVGFWAVVHNSGTTIQFGDPAFLKGRSISYYDHHRNSHRHCKPLNISKIVSRSKKLHSAGRDLGVFIAVHRCATYSLDTRRPRVLRRSASSLEQPSTAHKTYLLHGRLLKELEIFSVFMSILTVVFLSVFLFYVFILLLGALVMFLSLNSNSNLINNKGLKATYRLLRHWLKQ